MFPLNSKRVNDDLSKIRRSNLDPEQREKEDLELEEDKKQTKAKLKDLTFKDYIAMVIAVFSIIIPYLLILFAVLFLFVFLFYLIYLR
ncbi:MAG: hypothetical protein FWG21_06720 [Oscillospiraceae bacterium]|nr:hypothetical protein [Oscillospiraceae bacterium]